MAVALETLTFRGEVWYIDYRLREIRHVAHPENRITFDDIVELVNSIVLEKLIER